MKQILVWMDATAARRFIVQDLDDTHLVVHADSVEYALKALEEHVCLCLVKVCELNGRLTQFFSWRRIPTARMR